MLLFLSNLFHINKAGKLQTCRTKETY